jgi:nucleoside-diphosphate-sugar epimerase
MKEFADVKISIIGCGWLGLPLAINLIDKGFKVNGSSTSNEKLAYLKANDIAPFLVQLGKPYNNHLTDFLKSELLIVNVPPGRNNENVNDYSNKMLELAKAVSESTIKKIIFISSTSVYNENNELVDETSMSLSNSSSGQRMIDAENIFKNLKQVDTTIIRMAGLIGPKRHPGRFFAGKENIPNGLSPINLIHLDYCIGIIEYVIKNALWNKVFNGAAPTHPTKMEFYDLASQKLYDKRAKFIEEKGEFKIVDSSKIINEGYQFKHPNLMEWLLQNPQN